MALIPGTTLGPYEIVSPLGAGGMGEVYRARDSKLNRDVALKILPDGVAQDSDRVARFKREAQVLASLNHSHIAAIYGFDESGSTQFIVLELVEGETLADRLKRGPIPVDETIAIARQIAEALAEAHEKGIIHRDLKPANIALSGQDQVKVLDFGLAKLAAAPGGGASSSVSMSPTLTTPAMVTGVGMILGTAAYMAPEQAKGREADKRCDVWAFGCVVYEMLTAKRAFEGEDITDTIASIMRGEPDWTALPADTPASVRRLLESCLTKDRKRRAADIAVVQFLLDDRSIVSSAAPASETTQPRNQWTRLATAAAILVVAIIAAVAVTLLLVSRPSPPVARVAFDLIPPDSTSPLHLALSPDGSRLVVLTRSEKGSVLWLRALDQAEARTIPGSEWNASGVGGFPFWSPDSGSIGFFADGKLKKIDLSGAPPQVVTDARDGHGGTWNRDGVILFAPDNLGPLFRVSAAGGVPAQVTDLDPTRQEIAHRHPAFLPDGRHFMFLAVSAKPEQSAVFVASLDSKGRTLVAAAQVRAAFAPPDYLFFIRQNTLMAQRMDMRRFELRGDPIRIADRVGTNISNSAAGFTVSENGVLAWRLGGNVGETQLSWLDRDGKAIGTIGGPAVYRNPTLSPDQQRIVVDQEEASTTTRDLWILDVVRGTKSRFTFDPADDRAAIWSPDGTRIVFASNRAGGVFNLYQKNAGGAGTDELLLESAHNTRPEDWSSDGRFILYRYLDPKTKSDLWVLPLTGDRKPQPVLRSEFNEQGGRFSPDGRWIAYVSDESGQSQVYVQTFPVSGSKYQISTREGVQPRWRADGKELFFLSTEGINAVELSVAKDASLRAGVPKLLFPVRVQSFNNERNSWDVAPDGQRFLINPGDTNWLSPLPIRVVLNWTEAVAK